MLTLFDKIRALAHKLRKDGTDLHVIQDDLGSNPALPHRGRYEYELYPTRRAQLRPVWFRQVAGLHPDGCLYDSVYVGFPLALLRSEGEIGLGITCTETTRNINDDGVAPDTARCAGTAGALLLPPFLGFWTFLLDRRGVSVLRRRDVVRLLLRFPLLLLTRRRSSSPLLRFEFARLI